MALGGLKVIQSLIKAFNIFLEEGFLLLGCSSCSGASFGKVKLGVHEYGRV